MQVVRLLILSVMSAAATIGAVEGFTRLFAVAAETVKFPAEFATSRAFIRPDAELGFTLVPGYADGRYSINGAGFRGEPLPADLGQRFRILCMGNSTTFGWRVPEGQHFPAHLARLLRARAGANTWVVNAGVPSFTSAQLLGKLERDLRVVAPDIVVVTMPWNDMWYSSITPWKPDVLVPRVPRAWQRWLLKRSAFFRAVAAPAVTVPAVNTSAAEAEEVFAANLAAVIELVRTSGAVSVFQTPPMDLDHVGPEGVRFEPTGLRWERDYLLKVSQRYVSRFREVADRAAVPLVRNPLCMDDPGQHDLFVDEIHPTGAGYARIAEALLEALDAERLLAPAASLAREGGRSNK